MYIYKNLSFYLFFKLRLLSIPNNKLYIIQSLITKRIVIYGEIMKTRKISSILIISVLKSCIITTDQLKIQGEHTLTECTSNDITIDFNPFYNCWNRRS